MRGVKNFICSSLAALTLLTSCEKLESPEDALPYSNNNPSLNEKARILDDEQISKTYYYGNRNLYFSEPLDNTYELGTILVSPMMVHFYFLLQDIMGATAKYIEKI